MKRYVLYRCLLTLLCASATADCSSNNICFDYSIYNDEYDGDDVYSNDDSYCVFPEPPGAECYTAGEHFHIISVFFVSSDACDSRLLSNLHAYTWQSMSHSKSAILHNSHLFPAHQTLTKPLYFKLSSIIQVFYVFSNNPHYPTSNW